MDEPVENYGKTKGDTGGEMGKSNQIAEAQNQSGNNIVVIGNSSQNISVDSVDGLDPSVVRYVQQLLLQTGGQQSVIIVDEGANSEQTFQLEVLSGPGAEIHQHSLDNTSHAVSSVSASNHCSPAVASLSTVGQNSVSAEVNGAKSLYTVKPFAREILSDQRNSPKTTLTSKEVAYVNDSSSSVNLPDAATWHQSSSTAPSHSPYILSSQKSQTAENLLDIAHKLITNKKQANSPSHLVSNTNHPSSKPLKEEDKLRSESVITMYLSSPSELKNKLEVLKDNSPVVVVQAHRNVDNLTVRDAVGVCPIEGAEVVKSNTSSPKETTNTTSPSETTTSEKLVEFQATTSAAGEECVYRCQECGYSSHNKHYYKQHVDLVHNEDRPYKCPHCDYAGKRRHALLEHMVVHSNNRPFTCGHCNASFRKKGHLTNHIKLHTSQKLVHCGVCNIQLPDSEAFEAHLRKIHKTDKLYKCRLCEHTVVDREAMIRHFQTHTDPVVLTCPVCECQVNGENRFEEHMRVAHGSLNVSSSGLKSVSSVSSSLSEKNVVSSLTKIMCSECGFVSPDEETMQKHLWSHISVGTAESKGKGGEMVITSCEASKENSMGVLKKNIDSGQKTLPKDVFYQCTTCSFTSSDNSAFIKHMLAHKTQEKHVRDVTTEVSSLQELKGQSEGVHPPVSRFNQISSSSVLVPYTEVLPAKPGHSQARSENSIPFIYDKASARFRCLICNYHCEFQRTIKAHIWKHSGHQNIEYPMFDQSGNAMSGLVNVANEVRSQPKFSQGRSESAEQLHLEREKSKMVTVNPTPRPLQVCQIPSGEKVQLLPVNVSSMMCPAGGSSQVEDKTSSTRSSTTGATGCTSVVKGKDLDVITATQKLTDENNLATAETDNNPRALLEKRSVQTRGSAALKLDSGQATGKSVVKTKVDAGPSVVVEAVDSIPPGYSLTGLKSQQGSPRVSDLENSGGDSKFVTQVRTAMLRSRDNSADSDTSVSDSELWRSLKLTARGEQSSPLRCPFCDGQVKDDFKSHLLNCQAKVCVKSEEDGGTASRELKTSRDEVLSTNTRGEPRDSLVLDDTDSTESSDETATGDGPSGPKSGICSSLLAVIEQLRERSRSESEDDRQGQSSKKSGKKKGRQADLGLDSIDDLKNIEKISDHGGDKFRCALCHYTSERIYNIKIHMKTHRQKKPSECSLCDFSSTSPEALQEHMLKHCKVRTYACKYCPQNFNHKSTLRAHMRAHKDQEPFLCAYCVFETTNSQDYRDHMQVHSGCSSRLRCPGCDLLLAGKDELTAHLLACNGKSAGRLTSDASFKMNDKFSVNLASELKRQPETLGETTPAVVGGETFDSAPQHSCVVQGCAFSSSSLKELQDHLSVHCNPSLLVCNLCDFKAWHSRSLKSHMKRHANDQRYVQQPLEQYKCNLCGYVCHHLPSLKSHMWRHASDQSYSYEFTNDVINAAIDHDNRVDASGEADDPELLDQVINSERKILEGELTKCKRGDGQRPICWVTFRCCSCGFETINKAKLNIHMRTHSDLIQQAQALDIIPRRKRTCLDDKSQSLTSSLPKVVKTENL